LELKTAFPDEVGDILKEIKKGRVKISTINSKFKDKHVNHNLDVLARNGLLTRTYVREDGIDKIQIEFSGKDVTFRQGQKNYPKKKRGSVF
jgi:hypothetical protein